jgi:hypothetical protein
MEKQTHVNEALKRLEMMKNQKLIAPDIYKIVLDTFNKGDIPIFENQGFIKSAFYYLYGNSGQEPYDKLIKMKEQFEKEYGATVYMILISHFVELGTCYDFLYVSKQRGEWKMVSEDLQENYPMSYCHSSICEEFGSIGVKYDNVGGGIYRSA